MSPLIPSYLTVLLDYPFKLCAATALSTYVVTIITGNVSHVDRLWTVMPTIYSIYWALLPLWPSKNGDRWGYLVPYVPEEATHLAHDFSHRALLMLGLTVCTITTGRP
jgi:hypothetical protein